MAGAGRWLVAALVLSYAALGGLTQLVYGGSATTALMGIAGALILLLLAVGTAWASFRAR